jgi:N-acyl-D-aspartate/D-glutamate deacylase
VDLKICNGLIVDGSGRPGQVGDVGVSDGRIVTVRVGGGLEGEAAETIDAAGLAVLPGWVDVHSHYDGQVTWDAVLEPSSAHGVTTLVMGNCGVGFAPVQPGREEWLIGLMEGVEDIPGTALSEGMKWGWRTIPEYLDALGEGRFTVDVAAQVAHGPVRAYVMGERGARNEPSTDDDVAQMARLVREGVEAGAVGFSTSRELGHRAVDGQVVPGTYADERELFEIARAAMAGGRCVFEVAPRGSSGLEHESAMAELDWMCRLAEETGIPLSFLLFQVSGNPTLWRAMMDGTGEARAKGADIRAQVAARPFGMLFGLGNYHAFSARPTYRRLASQLELDELAAAMLEPGVRAAILSEPDLPPDPSDRNAGMAGVMEMAFDQLYLLGDPPDYEPAPERRLAALLEDCGEKRAPFLYDLLVRDGGREMMMLPMFNYVDGNHDAIYEMLSDDDTLCGGADGGAHCSFICDATYPTYLVSHWVRDRQRGPRLPLEFVVKKQTADTAAFYGFDDRGTITVGKRADLNVVDLEAINLDRPRVVHDLPAGGRRILQDATGYRETIVAGVVTRRDGVDTGVRPGRLIRGGGAGT